MPSGNDIEQAWLGGYEHGKLVERQRIRMAVEGLPARWMGGVWGPLICDATDVFRIIDPPTSSTDAVSSHPPPRVPPTSVAPAGEDHGAPDRHLPECGSIECDCTPQEECGPDCRNNCICDRLRAAEQRGDRYMLGIEVGRHDGWIEGHAFALGKAREAVEIVLHKWGGLIGDNGCNDIRAAIDEMRALRVEET